MSLKDSIEQLSDAFNAVAQELSAAYPAVWNKLNVLCGDDPRGKAGYMVYGHPPGYSGKTVLEVIDEYGEQAMLDYLNGVEAGVYI